MRAPLDGYTISGAAWGCGGFGEVYYATSDGGKDVALKLIRRNLDVELRGVRQCLNLKHPHLVELYDVRQDAQGDSWVVMQYMAGDCLETVLAAHPRGLQAAEGPFRWFVGRGRCRGLPAATTRHRASRPETRQHQSATKD